MNRNHSGRYDSIPEGGDVAPIAKGFLSLFYDVVDTRLKRTSFISGLCFHLSAVIFSSLVKDLST